MQNVLFDEKLSLKKLNDPEYVTIKDLDYSQPVAQKMFQHKKSDKKPKRNKGGVDHKKLPSRIQDKPKSLLHNVMTSLPLPLALIPEGTENVYDEEDEDEDEDDSDTERARSEVLQQQNADRAGKDRIKRVKLTKDSRRLSTQNESRERVVTRSMEKEQPSGRGASSSRRRKGAPSGTKRKLDITDNEKDAETVSDGEADGKGKTLGDAFSEVATSLSDSINDKNAFDLFTFDEPKKDWDDHPKMGDLMKLGLKKMNGVGWSSPKEGMGPELTMLKLAKLHQVTMPKKKKEGAKVLVRALAIERLMADDPNSSMYYEDTQTKK